MESVLFELDEQFYLTGFDAFGFESNQSLKLTVGKTYRVLWGDSEWNDLTAYDAGDVMPNCVYLGNASNFGLSGNNEPFLIASDGSTVMCLSLTDTAPVQRRVVVYGEAEKASGYLATLFSQIAGAIRGKNGEEGVEYYPAEFPGKIEGISAAKVVYGAITGNGGSMTITHNLGVVPDLILVYTGTAISNTKTYYIEYCIACSAAFQSLTGTGVVTMGITLYSDSTGAPRKIPFSLNYAFDMENTTNTTLPVRQANASTFVLGGTGADSMKPVLHKDVPYKWLAIGGLT